MPDLDNIPTELCKLPQWVVFRHEVVKGKPTKVPYQAAATARRASTTDPATWSTYRAAVDAARTEGVDGIGFVFTAEDPYAGIDFDHCVADGEIDPHVAAMIGELDSYAELSPSGEGLHVIVKASVNGARNSTAKTPWGDKFESYDHARFFTLTGRRVAATPTTVNGRQHQLDAIRAKLFPAERKRRTPAPTGAPADDRELLELARSAQNGPDLDALYRGEHSCYPSQSEADLALASMLAFWCGPDPARIDRLFRQGGLMREKWDSPRGGSTYGAQTIQKALADRTEFYSPRPRGNGATVRQEPTNPKRGSTRASTIRPRRIRWAWKGWHPLGYLAIQSGESGIGKSTQVCSTISDLTHGRLDGHLEGKPARVLVISSEDAREDVWVPRLTVAGADLELVEFQNQTREWNLRDGMKLTGQVLDEVDAKLVFIDSVFEHMPTPKGGGENIYSTDFIRRALGPFADLCKARQVAGVISTHPPKAKGSTFADMVIASAAFVHMTRVGLLFAWHPDDLELPDQERRRVLLRPPGGSNIGRDPGSFEFRVLTTELLIEGEPEEVPYTSDLTPSDVTFRDLTRTPRTETPTRTRIGDARAIIEQRLADGQWHRSMIDELIETGFSKSTAYNAAKGIHKRESPDGGWWWAMPGAPDPDFVELDRKSGSAARARGVVPEAGTDPSKPPESGSIAACSTVPGDFDENSTAGRDRGLVPDAGRDTRGREDADAELQPVIEKFGEEG